MKEFELAKIWLLANFQKAEDRFNAFSKRERGLALFSGLVAVYVVWHTVIFQVFFSNQKTLEHNIQETHHKIASVNTQIQVISAALANDPLHPLVEQVNALKQENTALQEKMVNETKQMVSPKEMAAIIKNLVEKTEGLNITLLESRGSKPLFETSQAEIVHFQVYQHGLKLEMTGDYFQILRFLKSVETQALKVLWNELDYSVEEYPRAKVKILIDTLGLEEDSIGV